MNDFEHTSAASAADALAKLGGAPPRRARPTPPPPRASSPVAPTCIPLMHDHLAAPTRLIDLKPAHDLRGVRLAADGALAIGALTTLTDIERDPP